MKQEPVPVVLSNVCAGIGRGQMTVLDAHIAHHKHVQELYRELLADVKGVHLHEQPADPRYDSNCKHPTPILVV